MVVKFQQPEERVILLEVTESEFRLIAAALCEQNSDKTIGSASNYPLWSQFENFAGDNSIDTNK